MGLMVGEYSSSLLLLLELLEVVVVVVVVEQRGPWQLAGPLEVEAVQEEQEEQEEQLGLMQLMSEEVLLEQRTSNKKGRVIQVMWADKRTQLRTEELTICSSWAASCARCILACLWSLHSLSSRSFILFSMTIMSSFSLFLVSHSRSLFS